MIRLDIKKAYDSVVHSVLTNRYLKEGWNSNLLKILIYCKRFSSQKIKINDSYTESILQSKGSRQGGIIQTLEFIF